MLHKIEWFDSGDGDPYENMAFDEVLFGEGQSVIRFYGWKEKAYSIGYFQKMNGKLSAPIVRRMTGGGTVEHGEDLTFSIVFDLKKIAILGQVKQSYSWIHKGVLEGLNELNISAQIHTQDQGEDGRFCFQSPTHGDLMLEGVKIVGGAQRRKKQILLHQGSLRMHRFSVTRSRLIEALLKGLGKTFCLDLKEIHSKNKKFKARIETLGSKYRSGDWMYKF